MSKIIIIFIIIIMAIVFCYNINVKMHEMYSYQTSSTKTITIDNQDIIFYLEFDNDDQYHLIPVVYTENGDYYMLHDINGNYDTMGTCFMEKEIVDINISNNYIINGHSSLTKNRNFTFLKNYADIDYFNHNNTFKLIDTNNSYTYQIIGLASFDLTNEDTYLDWYNSYFKDYEEFNNIMNNTLPYFINHIEGFSYHGQQIITLITCDMTKEDTRYVLFAYRKE